MGIVSGFLGDVFAVGLGMAAEKKTATLLSGIFGAASKAVKANTPTDELKKRIAASLVEGRGKVTALFQKLATYTDADPAKQRMYRRAGETWLAAHMAWQNCDHRSYPYKNRKRNKRYGLLDEERYMNACARLCLAFDEADTEPPSLPNMPQPPRAGKGQPPPVALYDTMLRAWKQAYELKLAAWQTGRKTPVQCEEECMKLFVTVGLKSPKDRDAFLECVSDDTIAKIVSAFGSELEKFTEFANKEVLEPTIKWLGKK